MCCDYIDYAQELQKLKREIIDEVVPSLHSLARLDIEVYTRAMLEMYRALKQGSFNAYRPKDSELWDVVAQAILIRVDKDVERTYMLAALFSYLLPTFAWRFEEQFCERLLSMHMPVRL